MISHLQTFIHVLAYLHRTWSKTIVTPTLEASLDVRTSTIPANGWIHYALVVIHTLFATLVQDITLGAVTTEGTVGVDTVPTLADVGHQFALVDVASGFQSSRTFGAQSVEFRCVLRRTPITISPPSSPLRAATLLERNMHASGFLTLTPVEVVVALLLSHVNALHQYMVYLETVWTGTEGSSDGVLTYTVLARTGVDLALVYVLAGAEVLVELVSSWTAAYEGSHHVRALSWQWASSRYLSALVDVSAVVPIH